MTTPSTRTRFDRRRLTAFGLAIALVAALVVVLAIDFGATERPEDGAGAGPTELERECAALIARLAATDSTEFRGPARDRIDLDILCSLVRDRAPGPVDSAPAPVHRRHRLLRHPDGGVELTLDEASGGESFAVSSLGDRFGRIREVFDAAARPCEDRLFAAGFLILPRGESSSGGAVASASWGRTADRADDPLRKFDVAVGPLVGPPLGGLYRLVATPPDSAVAFHLLHYRRHVLIGPDWRGSIEILMNGEFVAPEDLPFALAGEVRVRERFHLERTIVDRDGERKVVADADDAYRIVQSVSEARR